MPEHILQINELTFSAMHYIPNHPKCGVLHGHTFFVRNLRIITTGFVDFANIQAEIQELDHTSIVPREHADKWDKLTPALKEMGISTKFIFTDGDPTVENISILIDKRLRTIKNVLECSFKLFEGPNHGVVTPYQGVIIS